MSKPLLDRRTLVVALNLCLVAILWREFATSVSLPNVNEATVTNERNEQERPYVAELFALPGLEHFEGVVQHPLFSPDRRPAQGSSGSTSSLVLAGIITTPDSQQALVLHGKPAMLSHIGVGQTIDGWTAESISPDRVIFRNQAVDQELRLFPDLSNAAQISGAPSAQAAAPELPDREDDNDGQANPVVAPLTGLPTPPEL